MVIHVILSELNLKIMKRVMFVMMSMLLSSVLFAGNMKIEMDQYSRYEVKIDGKSYTTSKRLSINNLDRGRHSIKIYEVYRSTWGDSDRKLLYSGNFNIDRRETLYASYDEDYGLKISDKRYGNGYSNSGYGDDDYAYERDRQREIQRQRQIQRQRDYDRRRRVENQRRRNRNVCAPSTPRRRAPSRRAPTNRRNSQRY